MAAFDEIASHRDDAMHDRAHAEACISQSDDHAEFVTPDEPAMIPTPHLPTDSPSEQHSFRNLRRAVFRPLLAIITTQYAIVTVIACLAAIVTAQHASQIIHNKFAAISAALKRF